MNAEIGRRVAIARKTAGFTQLRLAGILGISQPLMAHFEAGRRSIPITLLSPFSEHLKVSVASLLGLSDSEQPAHPGPKSKLERQFLEAQNLSKVDQQFIGKFLDQFLNNNSTAH